MSLIDTPMNTAHHHAANADDYLIKGLIVLASEEHFKAAEAYISAIDRSNDESAKRTLRMLYNEHCKAGKELQRKIDKLKDEGRDPSLPQLPELSQKVPPPKPNSNSNTYYGSPRVNTSSPQPLRFMTDSQNTGDESFMLLGGQRSDPGDAFNQFWNIMQGMLDNLSQPVAFATVPLGHPEIPISPSLPDKIDDIRRDGSLSSDTDLDEPIFSKFTRRIGMSRKGSKNDHSGLSSRKFPSNGKQPEHEIDGSFEDNEEFLEGDDLSGSFCLVPSGPEPSSSTLKNENISLKTELVSMKSRLEATERMLKLRKEQDLQLRDSIFMATREAQRALGSSAMLQQRPAPPLDFSSLNINVPAVPIPGINTGREAQYARRVKELEDELRLMRGENEKHKLMIAKFRERWEKLKDSAKRKKEAKAATAGVVRERIVEEPEAEEELDDSNI